MKAGAKKALDRIRDAMHSEVRSLDAADYREVLEELATDIDAALEALDDEEPDREEVVHGQ